MTDDGAQLKQPEGAGWDDSTRFQGAVAFSFALPYLVPLEPQAVPIVVDEEYLRIRGVSPTEVDDSWMVLPLPCLTVWSVESSRVDSLFDDAELASAALSRLTGQPSQPPNLQEDADARNRSVAVVVMPVKDRGAAFTPPHDGKVDPLTLAHWLVADAVRSLRIASSAPIPELHYRSLNPIVPATFGAVDIHGQVRFDEKQSAIVLDHLPTRLEQAPHVDPADAGNIFNELTHGSITALIRDHFARAYAEHVAGDRRASVLSLAITCELLLDSVLSAMLWEEGQTPAEAAQVWASGSSVTHRIKSLYAVRLGGDWNLNGHRPIARWREHIADVRNSVIHSGRTPSEPESEHCGIVTSELLAFVTTRLMAKWKTYPKTLAVLCGPTSVEKHAPKKHRANILAELKRCSVFGVEFHRWHDKWLKERTLLS
ncbi:MAG: hypothetical protein KDB70_19005 [Mycobacterium sp.]|nr:hypothetical protein [Mycobacterium sp.]